MRLKLKLVWQWFRAGIVPLFIAAIPIYLSYWLWMALHSYGIHPTGNPFCDVPITIALIIFTACLSGYLVSRQWFEELSKKYLIHIPIIGWMIVIFVLPKRKLNLVEVKSTWGPAPEESCWEFALETCDPWEEDKLVWHRVHTLGWTGKLFCRIGDKNIRALTVPPHKAWMTILSMGLL